MKETEEITFSEKKEEINKVVEVLKNYSYDQLTKRNYFWSSLIEKNTDEKLLKDIYPQFWRINLIAFRSRKEKNSNYDIYYELDNGYALLFAIDLSKKPPILINAFPFSKNLKRFIAYLKKKYAKEMLSFS